MIYGSLNLVLEDTNDDYIAEVLVEEAVCSMIETGKNNLMEALANQDYGAILENVIINEDDNSKTKDNLEQKLREFYRAKKAKETINDTNLKYAKDDTIDDDITIGQLTNADEMHKYRNEKAKKAWEADKEKDLWAMAKRAVGKGRDFIAKLIGKLNSWVTRIVQKEAEAGKRDYNSLGFFQKIKRNILAVIEFLTRKLHNLIQSKRGNISKYLYSSRENDFVDLAHTTKRLADNPNLADAMKVELLGKSFKAAPFYQTKW